MITGKEIKRQMELGNIVIKPFDEKRLNPNSYNVTLNNELYVYDEEILDMKKPNKTRKIIIPEEGLVLQPNKLYLGRTNEYTETRNLVPCIDGRSSIGRLGLFIHVTAGFGDVGFKGTWTLEIQCIEPIRIYPNTEIGQLHYELVQGEQTLYSGKYLNQIDATPSRMNLDFDKR